MAKILSFDNKLMKIGNGLLGPAEAAPTPVTDYRLEFSGGTFRLRNLDPGATSGYSGTTPLSETQLNNINGSMGEILFASSEVYSFVFTNVTSNTLSFTHDSNGATYTLYKIVSGSTSIVATGTLSTSSSNDVTISLT